jgi:tetratricopeptide (TPR) repeat protein
MQPKLSTFIMMIHHHHAVAILVLCLLAFTKSSLSAEAEEDSLACAEVIEEVKKYSYRYDANDSLRYWANQMLHCADSVESSEIYMEALSVLGVTYLRDNDYPKALEVFRKNQQMAVELNDSLTQAKVLVNLASTYTKLDSAERAMELLLKSAELFERQQDSTMLMYVYNNVAILFGKIREREEQLYYCKKAFDAGGGEIKDHLTLTLAANLAVNLLNSGVRDSSERLALRALRVSKELKNAKTTTQLLTHLANLANRKEAYDDAIRYTDEVLEYEGRIKHNHTFAQLYAYRGIALLKTGKTAEAVLSLEKALQYAEAEKSLQRRELVFKHLQVAYAKAGDYQKAYEALTNYKQTSDSLASEENVRILNDLETKYETEKKEQQIKELAQQQQISELKLRQRSIWIIILVIVAIAIALAIYLVSRQRLLKEQQKALENRLLSLRVQLNPHFIFNALTAVQNYMLSGKDLRQATRYLSNFAKVMRAFLEYNQEDTISLEKELHALGLYVGIQELRFSNGFEFEVNVDEEIMPEHTMVPPMIMQPLIENAIEHGIRNIENGKLALSYKLIGDQLEMRLEDNGIGRDRAAKESKKAEDKTSLATKITNERISLLNKKGHGAYTFIMQDANPDGTVTVAIFTIPYLEL